MLDMHEMPPITWKDMSLWLSEYDKKGIDVQDVQKSRQPYISECWSFESTQSQKIIQTILGSVTLLIEQPMYILQSMN